MINEILRASYLENIKWAKELNELFGATHPKSKSQWQLCNNMVNKLNEELKIPQQ